jgi:hypothetical protein
VLAQWWSGTSPSNGIETESPKSWPSQAAEKSFDMGDRLTIEVCRRLFAAFPVGLFAFVQYRWYWYDQRYGNFEPNWVLGPFYFLVNASGNDDWIGYALLAVFVPCLLGFVIWPGRWTALVASLTALAWVSPGGWHALAEP